jgi:hypothetical protein
VLLAQTEEVCKELIRVSALWPEEWHATLQEASCLYFDDNNVAATKKVSAYQAILRLILEATSSAA